MSKRTHKSASPPEKVRRKAVKYTQALTTEICARIASGKSMRAVCRAKNMPASSTVFVWLTKHPDFAEKYRLAMEQRAFTIIEEALQIADDAARDYEATRDGKANVEHIQRTKLRVAARQWAFAGLRPVKYGAPKAGDSHDPENGSGEQVIRWANTETEATADPSEKTPEAEGEAPEPSENS